MQTINTLQIESESCTSCRNFVEVRENLRPNASEFIDYLPWFLNDNPGINCSKGLVLYTIIRYLKYLNIIL